MTLFSACRRVHSQLDAFIDGELGPTERAAVTRHLKSCLLCAEEERELRGIGGLLRESVQATPGVELTGLASRVISRVSAERAQSWRAFFARAVEDWHYALAGAGSVAAGAGSILFVSALLWFGPSPSRNDSLEALLNNLGTPAGTLLIVGTPDGRDQMLMRFDSGSMNGYQEAVAVPVSFSGPSGRSEEDLTAALSDMMIGSDGRVRGSRGMTPIAREHAEALLDEIERLRYPSPASWSGGSVGILRLGLVTSTMVTAKAL